MNGVLLKFHPAAGTSSPNLSQIVGRRLSSRRRNDKRAWRYDATGFPSPAAGVVVDIVNASAFDASEGLATEGVLAGKLLVGFGVPQVLNVGSLGETRLARRALRPGEAGAGGDEECHLRAWLADVDSRRIPEIAAIQRHKNFDGVGSIFVEVGKPADSFELREVSWIQKGLWGINGDEF
ncbi:hypothetical protein U1Q18_000807 [Sarracenia purpurea var. burkii]